MDCDETSTRFPYLLGPFVPRAGRVDRCPGPPVRRGPQRVRQRGQLVHGFPRLRRQLLCGCVHLRSDELRSVRFKLTNTLVLVPLVFAFYYMFTNAPSYIAGEFRRTSKSISRGMAASFGLAVAFAAAIVYAFESVVGMDFLNGSVALSTWFFEGGSDPRILPFASGLTALPNFVAGGNPILLGIMFLGSVSWYVLWLILGLYIFSRYALSFSLDRLFPKWLGNVTRRTHQPWAGILVISAIGAILLPLVAYNYATVYNPFVFLLFFLPMVTVALTSLSLVRLGLQKHRMGYVGVGILSFVVTVAAAYLVSTLQSLGEAAGFTLSNQLTSYVTIIIVFVGGAIWYFGARAFHLRRHGVDISMAFKELPPDCAGSWMRDGTV